MYIVIKYKLQIKNGNGALFFNEGVKGSELIDFFGNMVGIEDQDSAEGSTINVDASPNVVQDIAEEHALKDSKHKIVLNLDGNLRGKKADSKATEDEDVEDIEETNKLDTKKKNVSKNGEEEGKICHFFYVFHRHLLSSCIHSPTSHVSTM